MGWMYIEEDGFFGPSAAVGFAAFADASLLAPALAPVAWEGWLAMERVAVAAASALAFSTMAFCFPSSFARIGTRSSGMGLLSCRVDVK